jgi:hypothetical protein
MDARPKLHCLAKLISEEVGQTLQPSEVATLAVALKFDEIMASQVLQDVAEELTCEGTRPIERDHQELTAAISHGDQIAKTVRTEQKRLILQHLEAQKRTESESFRQIIQRHTIQP